MSKLSLAVALIELGAGVGLVFFVLASAFALSRQDASQAIIPALSGAIVEVVAGVVFYLYGKTTAQMEEFHNRLERLQLYLVANSMCESLQAEQRDSTRSKLIGEIAAFAGGGSSIGGTELKAEGAR